MHIDDPDAKSIHDSSRTTGVTTPTQDERIARAVEKVRRTIQDLIESGRENDDDRASTMFRATSAEELSAQLKAAQEQAQNEGCTFVSVGSLNGGTMIALLAQDPKGPGGSVVLAPPDALAIAFRLIRVAFERHQLDCREPLCGISQFLAHVEHVEQLVLQEDPAEPGVPLHGASPGGMVN